MIINLLLLIDVLLFLLAGIVLQAFQVLRSLGVTVQMISQGASKVFTLSAFELCVSPSICPSTANKLKNN